MRHYWKILVITMTLILPISAAWAVVSLQIKIIGIQGEAAENAEKRLKGRLTLIQDDLDQETMMSFYRQAENEIKLAIAPYGYFQSTVSSDLKSLGKDRWIAYFNVRPGPKIRLRHLTLRIDGPGKNDPSFKKALANIPLKVGKALSIKEYNEAKESFVNIAAQRGYFDAKMTTTTLHINQEPYGADVTLIFNTGPRYRFGDLSFEYVNKPKRVLADSFLHRYVPFKKGDYYDNEQLSKMQTNLSSSLYFQSVNLTPLPQTHDLTVPISVKMTARQSQQYNFGLGFSTDSGVRGLSDINLRPLTSTGHYLSFNTKASASQSNNSANFKVSYNIPGFHPSTDLYKITTEAQHSHDSEVGDYDNLKMNASYSNLVKTWEQTIGLTLLAEHSEPINEAEKTSTFLIPNGRWIKLKSDDPMSPTKGYRINFSMRGASQATLGSCNFFQAYLQAQWLHSFRNTFRVIARAETGFMAIENTNNLPISLRFYAGGSQSVRGYHLNEIGSNESGRTLAVGSLELQQRVYGNFYFSVFYDAGEVGPSYFSGYQQGVGAGIVWHSPVGALALTVANAFSSPNHPILVQFSMGPEL
jgi:translocation and assembly module TamA